MIFFRLSILLLVLFFLTATATASATGAAMEPFQDRTASCLFEMDREKTLSVSAVKGVAASFSYGQALIARSFAAVDNGTSDPAATLQAWKKIAAKKIPYKAAELLARLCTLKGMNLGMALSLLEMVPKLPQQALHTLDILVQQGHVTAHMPKELFSLLATMDAPALWAAQSYFAVFRNDPVRLVGDLGAIKTLSVNSALAIEACADKAKDEPELARTLLPLFSGHDDSSAWAAATLCRVSHRTIGEDVEFIQSFLLQPPDARDKRYFAMSDAKKSFVLELYEKAAGWAVGRLNRLHGVTDGIGAEFSDNFLFVMSSDELTKLFHELAGSSAEMLGAEMEQARREDDRAHMVRLLKKAARMSRRALAREMSDVELYVLVAAGEPLYDSSFRDVVVPELLSRHVARAGIMALAGTLDPQGVMLDRAMVNLARRGMLERFMGSSVSEQNKFIKRVAATAFSTVEGLLDFSVSMERLMPRLVPGARLLLVEKMAESAATANGQLRQLLLTMGTFFHEQLKQQKKITPVMASVFAHIPRSSLDWSAPFETWTEDREIRALSVFQADDDGWRSFVGFCKKLLERGYRPEMAAAFPVPIQKTYAQELRSTVAGLSKNKTYLLHLVHRLLYYGGGAVDFSLSKGPVRVVQTVTLNTGTKSQTLLLKWFIAKDMEILSQRGHSYWRTSQVLAPMAALRKRALHIQTDLARQQRFISLGSCGSMKAFWQVAHLFAGSVDMLATVGTGTSQVNDLYTILLPEYAAEHPASDWNAVRRDLAYIFDRPHGRGYIAPGSLPFYLGRALEKKQVKDTSTH